MHNSRNPSGAPIVQLLRKKPVYHSLFWLAYFAYNLFLWGYQPDLEMTPLFGVKLYVNVYVLF